MFEFTIDAVVKFLTEIDELDSVSPPSFPMGNVLKGFSALSETKPDTVSWMKSKDQPVDWNSIQARLIICPAGTESQNMDDILLAKVKHPRLAFTKVLQKFSAIGQDKYGIEKTAIIGADCSLGENTYIGHYSILGNNVKIGDNTIIYGHVTIYDRVTIGKNCIINSGTVIGADGFGYEKDLDGLYIKIPHLGSVVIEDDVEIGGNTCIDRGVLADTVIRQNVKIDNLCHIAHNVSVGKNSTVIALAMIGGSVHIGDNSWISPSAVIKNGINIGADSLVGLGAVVLRDVSPGQTVIGVPAKPLNKE